jgi:hypothetical protein
MGGRGLLCETVDGDELGWKGKSDRGVDTRSAVMAWGL